MRLRQGRRPSGSWSAAATCEALGNPVRGLGEGCRLPGMDCGLPPERELVCYSDL